MELLKSLIGKLPTTDIGDCCSTQKSSCLLVEKMLSATYLVENFI
jgi:hypothetical protein